MSTTPTAPLTMAEVYHFASVLGRAPSECVFPWLSFELLQTQAAVDRVRAWFAAGAVEPTGDDVVRRTRFLGDAELRTIVVNCLFEDVPPPVQAYLLEAALFVGCGWSAAGWTCRVELGAPKVLILLSGASRDPGKVRDVVLHESAHAFLGREVATPLPAADVFNVVGASLLNAAADPTLMQAILRDSARDERQADGLARTWGAGVMHNDEHAAAHTRAEAAALAARYGK